MKKRLTTQSLTLSFGKSSNLWESLPHGATGILRGPLGRTNRISPPLRRTATVTLCMSFLKFSVVAPPQSYDECSNLERYANRSLASDKTGKKDFYLYLMWRDFSKRMKGITSGSVSTSGSVAISYKNHLLNSYKAGVPDAVFLSYIEKKEVQEGLVVHSKYRRSLFECIDKILAHHPDGSLKEYYFDLEFNQLVCELGPSKGHNQYEEFRDRLKRSLRASSCKISLVMIWRVLVGIKICFEIFMMVS